MFSAGRATSLTLAEKVAGQGAVMINNSSASRRDPDVPLVVCEVNPHALAHRSSVSPPEEPKRLIGRRQWDSKGCASSLSSSDVQDQRCAHLGTPAQQDSAQRRRTPLNSVGGASGKSKPAGENPVTGPVRFPSPAPYMKTQVRDRHPDPGLDCSRRETSVLEVPRLSLAGALRS
ncbi:hypothetical protein [Microbispora bryophytorum]|uniref:hypothetical protein n=1 Tax=Microbispora bryophytorum TaxID=1460882 RepID=UPI0033EA8625